MPDIHEALYWFNQDIQGAWYGWINKANGEVYSNLKLINDDATMPTEEQVNAKIAEFVRKKMKITKENAWSIIRKAQEMGIDPIKIQQKWSILGPSLMNIVAEYKPEER